MSRTPVHFLVLDGGTLTIAQVNITKGKMDKSRSAFVRRLQDAGMWVVQLHPRAAEILRHHLEESAEVVHAPKQSLGTVAGVFEDKP